MLKRFLAAGVLLVSVSVVLWNVRTVQPSAEAAFGSPLPMPTPPPPAPCAGPNLSLRFQDTDAAMGGVRETGYAFKNIGAWACTLTGFPKVQLLNSRGQVVHAKLVKNAEDTPATITLKPKKEAFFVINSNSGGAGHEGPPCPSVHRLRIQAPDTDRWFNRRDEIDLCTDVRVGAVTDTSSY